MSELTQIGQFICELDKLKAVKRQVRIKTDENRQENSAEHSWHVALMATTLGKFAVKPIDINRVVKMILIHDVVEIEAGDLFAFSDHAEHSEQAEKELAAAKKIFGLLPSEQADELLKLWLEFEDAQTDDAEFAKSMDRVLPVFQNMNNDGGSWKAHSVPRHKIEKRNEALKQCAPALWDYVCSQLDIAVEKGWLSS